MTGIQIIGQFKQNTCFHTARIIGGNAQFNGKTIHRPKGRIQLHQHIRIIVEQFHGRFTILLIHLHCQFCRQLVGCHKFHKLPHTHTKTEFFANGLSLGSRNAGNLSKSLRLPLHNIQSALTKFFHDPGGRSGSDALDDPA